MTKTFSGKTNSRVVVSTIQLLFLVLVLVVSFVASIQEMAHQTPNHGTSERISLGDQLYIRNNNPLLLQRYCPVHQCRIVSCKGVVYCHGSGIASCCWRKTDR
jgi:hypothetical protein